VILQIDGVFRYVSPGLQLFFPIFRGTTLKGETTVNSIAREFLRQAVLATEVLANDEA
jgi:hypothetical protein